MDAITLLQGRNSAPRLCEPAPSEEVLGEMLRAAMRAPDHARLRPWRFLTVSGDARGQLGELFVESEKLRAKEAGEEPPSDDALIKLSKKTLRAPLVLVVIADIKIHPKVPEIEQLMSAACAAHAILLAAQALGFAGIWRTGKKAYDEVVMKGLGLAPQEAIVGFLYIGSVEGGVKSLPEMSVDQFCHKWERIIRD